MSAIRDEFNVETDEADWPVGLPEAERKVLKRAVIDELRRCGPCPTYELHRRVCDNEKVLAEAPTFSKAVILDWLCACVVRAARSAFCEQRWHAHGTD